MENITGKILIDMGYAPAPWFGIALSHFSTLQEGGRTPSEVYVRSFCDAIIKKTTVETIPLRNQPLPYEVFVEANTADEKDNLKKSVEAMDRIMVTPTIVSGAIMPDVCPVGGNNIPVGGVAVTEGTIHPEMHSSDVCCSVATSELPDSPLSRIDIKEMLDVAMRVTHFGPGGRRRNAYGLEDHSLYDRILNNYFTKDYVEKAVSHMATQGDGNHFLFIGRSQQTGSLHIVTHHGSRGFGASVYKKGLHEARQYCKKICPDTTNPWLDYDSDLGREYWEALQIIKSWTHLNHDVIHNRLLNMLGVPRTDFYWNEHNFVFKEGNKFYHAKGSTPMSDRFDVGINNHSPKRLIPLNMAEPVLVVKEHPNNTFGFAPHGAGRNLSRSEFSRRLGDSDLQKSVRGLDIRFYSGEPDLGEFPSAYKNAAEVTRQIEKFQLAEVVDTIHPLGCIMAGKQNTHWKKK